MNSSQQNNVDMYRQGHPQGQQPGYYRYMQQGNYFNHLQEQADNEPVTELDVEHKVGTPAKFNNISDIKAARKDSKAESIGSTNDGLNNIKNTKSVMNLDPEEKKKYNTYEQMTTMGAIGAVLAVAALLIVWAAGALFPPLTVALVVMAAIGLGTAIVGKILKNGCEYNKQKKQYDYMKMEKVDEQKQNSDTNKKQSLKFAKNAERLADNIIQGDTKIADSSLKEIDSSTYLLEHKRRHSKKLGMEIAQENRKDIENNNANLNNSNTLSNDNISLI